MVQEVVDREVVREAPVARQQTVATTSPGPGVVIARVISWLTSALLVLLALRLVFSLLGANQSNGIAQFIYGLSYPFVAPFFGLFGYTMQYGVARFEVETLAAIVIYGIIGYGLAKLVGVRRTVEDI